MGTPTTTARVDPVGIKLPDGHSTQLAFAADPDVSFWEKVVKPPGIDGGDAIEQTTMYNEEWRTFAARALKTLTESGADVAYDPRVIDQIMALVNVEGSITLHFPNNSTLDFFGFLRTWEPEDMEEGTQPTAHINITCTNTDPTDGSESAPNFKLPSGTD